MYVAYFDIALKLVMISLYHTVNFDKHRKI